MLNECAHKVKYTDAFNLENNGLEFSWISKSVTVCSCSLYPLIRNPLLAIQGKNPI